MTDAEALKAALKVIESSRFTKVQKDNSNLAIQQLREEGFLTKTPIGTKRIGSKMMMQAELKFTGRIKPLDFQIHGTGRPEWMETLVTMAVATVMKLGGYISALRDKGGAFSKLFNYGDGYVMVGSNPDPEGKSPIIFMPIPNQGVHWDSFATVVRGAWGLSASQCVVIFSYQKDEAKRLYPDLPDDCQGKIPRATHLFKDLDRKYEQKWQNEKDELEVAHYFDIADNQHLIFAGTACDIIEHNEDKKYPFTYTTAEGKKEAYIPVLDFMCLFATEGMWNHGFGEVLYDLAIVDRMLMNMGTAHSLDVGNPIWNYTVPKGEASKLPEKMRAAQEAQAMGKKGFITTEYNPANPGANQISVNSLMAQNGLNELLAWRTELTKELKRFGLDLDAVDYSSNPNQMEILAKDENQAGTIKQIMEWNAGESEKAVEFTMEMIKRYVSKNDKTPLNMTTAVEAEGIEFKPDSFTLGMVADELRKYDYFVISNSRSGTIPSGMMKMAGLQSMLAMSQPGSPGWAKLATQIGQANNVDIKGGDLLAPMMGTAPAPENQPAQAPVAQTDRQPLTVK